MIFYLDTNICIYSLNGRFPAIASFMQRRAPADIKIKWIVEAELLVGDKKSLKPDDTLEKIQKFLSPFEVIPFDHKAAGGYADIRAPF